MLEEISELARRDLVRWLGLEYGEGWTAEGWERAMVREGLRVFAGLLAMGVVVGAALPAPAQELPLSVSPGATVTVTEDGSQTWAWGRAFVFHL